MSNYLSRSCLIKSKCTVGWGSVVRGSPPKYPRLLQQVKLLHQVSLLEQSLVAVFKPIFPLFFSQGIYTLLKKKRTFNSSIFLYDPGSGSVTLGHGYQFNGNKLRSLYYAVECVNFPHARGEEGP